MIIICEGPNGVGKTALAKNISALLGIPYRKENKPDRPGFPYYLEAARRVTDVVLDRFHLGERVYPQLKRDGRVPLERWQQREIERAMLSSGAVLVRCTAPLPFIERVHDERGETFIAKEDIPEEVGLFMQAFSDTILPEVYAKIDESITEAERLATVAAGISRRFMQVRDTFDIGSAYESAGNIGQWGPPIMLVGERYGDGSYVGGHDGHRALCGEQNGSAFLHRALDRLPDELSRRIYITNLWKHPDDARNTSDLLLEAERLRPGRIIALGQRVATFLDKNTSFVFRAVNHPQHAARFHYRELEAYAASLLAAMGGEP